MLDTGRGPVNMKVGELARRLEVPYRDVRYVLERGALPSGLPAGPGRGAHRDLGPAQAFWLAIVLAFKRCGVSVPEAKAMADLAREAVANLAQRAGYDPGFDPFAGRLVAARGWAVEMGDADAVRVVRYDRPDCSGPGFAHPWGDRLDHTRPVAADPVVTLRLNITRLAGLLAG